MDWEIPSTLGNQVQLVSIFRNRNQRGKGTAVISYEEPRGTNQAISRFIHGHPEYEGIMELY